MGPLITGSGGGGSCGNVTNQGTSTLRTRPGDLLLACFLDPLCSLSMSSTSVSSRHWEYCTAVSAAEFLPHHKNPNSNGLRSCNRTYSAHRPSYGSLLAAPIPPPMGQSPAVYELKNSVCLVSFWSWSSLPPSLCSSFAVLAANFASKIDRRRPKQPTPRPSPAYHQSEATPTSEETQHARAPLYETNIYI